MCLVIDLSMACDTISHPPLVDSLEQLGITGKFLKLFDNYLKERQQLMKIDHILSEQGKIEYGNLQGTNLGATLFRIFINNLFCIESYGTIIEFGDDTGIFDEADSLKDLKLNIERRHNIQ